MPHRNLRLLLLLVALAALALGCGSSSTSNSSRMLQSIAISPATADAQNFTSGQVQFSAIGTFSASPSPAPVTFQTPYLGNFLVDDPTVATVVSNGMGTITVQCVAGASGSTGITATACKGATGTSQVCAVVWAHATLSCP